MRTALITGVSRRAGIGFAIARRLIADGVTVFVHHYVPHDRDRPWGADHMPAVLALLGSPPDAAFDLAVPGAPAGLMEVAVEALGHVDILICNHASSGPDGDLSAVTDEMLDHHYAVNTRASLMLVQAFAAQHDGRPGGRVVLMTSGQNLGPMRGQIAYATSKGALAAITATLSDTLIDRGITVNCVNPGPVDTGWPAPDVRAAVGERMPLGWAEPDDPARLIAWLVSEEGRWVTGQVLNSEGGFRR
ncbi:SDR family oxidoreductase [Solirubrobacter ginsenosidimutans]|uniref:SDR family oxidoreductase n=1 Tax=Solirubrobacter ginsenosidimutans TaxID=490573 RepID=A0A9X3N134_9ACTN|nr:SDR family oxidoreductase [Solirubrobacter ginsenosidimutans]MDA0162953.1 SDR family oxidoreductase [Solirubrobacter ginsenosidimutans]